jgi:lipid II:glycine glycyltransferase (peptidoglycan interpeptide bridge formation enzyme)
MRTEFERIKEGGRRLNFSGIKGKNYHSRSLFGLAE